MTGIGCNPWHYVVLIIFIFHGFGFGFWFLVFRDRLALNSRDPPASASQMLGLKSCATIAWLNSDFDGQLEAEG
jgi:hypothetical protein